MTIRLLALLACLPLVGAAQLRVFVVDGEAERELAAQLDMGRADPGDSIETRFRVRNSGVSAETVRILTLGGAGFSFSNRPSIPYVIAPGFFMDFRVKFEPIGPGSYSASLAVNSITAILRASSPPVLTVTSEGVALTTTSPLDFGNVELGSTAVRRIVITNNTSGAMTLSTVVLSGEAFGLETALTLPRVLQPRTTVNLETAFTPRAPGSFEGRLLVNDRLFTLKGSAANPPVPRATISISPAVTSSGKQPKVSIELASPAEFTVTGVLTLGFQANASHSDPTVLFVRSGSKSIGFTVAQGETRATFSGGETRNGAANRPDCRDHHPPDRLEQRYPLDSDSGIARRRRYGARDTDRFRSRNRIDGVRQYTFGVAVAIPILRPQWTHHRLRAAFRGCRRGFPQLL